jgi:hypothetical protein
MASLANAMELSGLSKTLVENAATNDTTDPYSLSNYNADRINKLVDDVFSKKLKVPAKPGMVRFTFIIGGGKKVREKYDPACQKNLTAALRKYNFEDDQGAALLPECAGKYKTQHDTNLNLKYVHVFPFVEPEEDDSNNNGGEDTMSKQFICMVAERPTFERMVLSEVKFWKQKKALMNHLKDYVVRGNDITNKMINMEELNESEQKFFDVFDSENVKDKISWIQNEMKRQVSAGTLTEEEKRFMLNQANNKLKILNEKLVENANNEKKIKTQIEQVEKRIEHLNSVKGIAVPFRNEREFCDLVGLLQPHLLRQDAGKPIKANEQAEMDDLRSQMNQLIEDARLWFESDDDLKVRVEKIETAYLKKKRLKKSVSQLNKGGNDGWSTVGKKKGSKKR